VNLQGIASTSFLWHSKIKEPLAGKRMFDYDNGDENTANPEYLFRIEW
jgi:hypothetical protein